MHRGWQPLKVSTYIEPRDKATNIIVFTTLIEMGVLPQIARRLDEILWILPTGIQADAVPLVLGGDVLMAAESCSGKTGNLNVMTIIFFV